MKTRQKLIAEERNKWEKKVEWMKEQAATKIEALKTEIERYREEEIMREIRLGMMQADEESKAAEDEIRRKGLMEDIGEECGSVDLSTALKRIEKSESMRKIAVKKLEKANSSLSELQAELTARTQELEARGQSCTDHLVSLTLLKDCVLTLAKASKDDEDCSDLQLSLQLNRLDDIRAKIEDLAHRVREQYKRLRSTISSDPQSPGKEEAKAERKSPLEKPHRGSKTGSQIKSMSPEKQRKSLKFAFDESQEDGGKVGESHSPIKLAEGNTGSKPGSKDTARKGVLKARPSDSGVSIEAEQPEYDGGGTARGEFPQLTIDTTKVPSPTDSHSSDALFDSPKSAPLKPRKSLSHGTKREALIMRGKGLIPGTNEGTQMSRSLLNPVTESPENQFLVSLRTVFGRYIDKLQKDVREQANFPGDFQASVESLSMDEMMCLEVQTGRGREKLAQVVLKSIENALIGEPPQAAASPRVVRKARFLFQNETDPLTTDLRITSAAGKEIYAHEKVVTAISQEYLRLMDAEARRRGIKKLTDFNEQATILDSILESRVNESADDEIANYLRKQPGRKEYQLSKQLLASLIISQDVQTLTGKLLRLPPQTPRQRQREAECVKKWKKLIEQHWATNAKRLGNYMAITDSAEVWYRMAINIKHVKHRLVGIKSRLRTLVIAEVDQIQPWSGGETTPARSALPGAETTPARADKTMSFPSAVNTPRMELKSKLIRKRLRGTVYDDDKMKAMLPALTTGSSGSISWNSWTKSSQKLSEFK